MVIWYCYELIIIVMFCRSESVEKRVVMIVWIWGN
jgi:hypothetical protein